MTVNPYEAPAPAMPAQGVAEREYFYKPNHGRAVWARWWILVTAILGTVLAAPLFYYEPYLNMEPDALMIELGWSEQQVLNMFMGLIGLSLVHLATFLVGAVLFCLWAYRANHNAHALGAHGMRFSPGWSIGYYFIPIMFFFTPYQAMKEVYQSSDPDADNHNWTLVRVPGWMLAWWLTWIVANILENAGFRMSLRDNPTSLEASRWASLLASVLSLAAAALVFRLIRTVEARQQARLARQQQTIPPPVYPTGNRWGDSA